MYQWKRIFGPSKGLHQILPVLQRDQLQVSLTVDHCPPDTYWDQASTKCGYSEAQCAWNKKYACLEKEGIWKYTSDLYGHPVPNTTYASTETLKN